MSETQSSANRQIARAAGTVMFAFVFSSLVGLVGQILIAKSFGTTENMDAFNVANQVPETLFNLVAGGALSSAFIPTFTSLLTRGDRKGAWKLASSIANLILLILTLAGVLTWIFAPLIVRYILAPSFASDPAKEAQTISLMRMMLPSSILFGLSALVMGILNSHQIFLFPALAPAMFQLGLIFGVLVLSPKVGIVGLAWGVVIGSGLHLLLQVPVLFRLGGKYVPTLGLKTPDVREVARLIGPRLLGVAIVQLNFWINTRLASQFTDGSVTGVVMGFTLMLMPEAAIAQSIAIAAMPTFSAQVALGKLAEMRASLAASLRGVLLLSIPASVGLMMLRIPAITLLYQRGEFTSRSTQLVAWALLWYAAGMVGHSLVEILARAFYSLHNTKTPVFVGIGAMSLNIVFSYLFSALFLRLGWEPLGGLALANSVATGLEAAGLVLLMRRRLGGLEGMKILSGMVKVCAAASLMGMALWGWLQGSKGQPAWLVVGGGVAIGGIIFLGVTYLLGVSEIKGAVKILIQRLARQG